MESCFSNYFLNFSVLVSDHRLLQWMQRVARFVDSLNSSMCSPLSPDCSESHLFHSESTAYNYCTLNTGSSLAIIVNRERDIKGRSRDFIEKTTETQRAYKRTSTPYPQTESAPSSYTSSASMPLHTHNKTPAYTYTPYAHTPLSSPRSPYSLGTPSTSSLPSTTRRPPSPSPPRTSRPGVPAPYTQCRSPCHSRHM